MHDWMFGFLCGGSFMWFIWTLVDRKERRRGTGDE